MRRKRKKKPIDRRKKTHPLPPSLPPFPFPSLPLPLPLPLTPFPLPPRKQIPILKRHWWVILLCLAFQYVHGVFTQLSYVLARPEPQPLPDVGFAVLPELPLSADWASETLFYAQFFGGIAWMFSPFVVEARRLRHTTVGLASAALPALALAQALRIASFTSTRLPSPAPHCLSASPVAVKPRPAHWWQFIAVNVVTQASKSCGDLIFSSHLTFALSFCILYSLRGNLRVLKVIWWLATVALSLLIIASRKHYSVDIVVAWYAVPLIFFGLTKTQRWRRLSGRRPEVGGGGGKDGRGSVVERRDEAAERKRREEEEQRREGAGVASSSSSPAASRHLPPSAAGRNGTPAATTTTTQLTEVRVVGVGENGEDVCGGRRERGR